MNFVGFKSFAVVLLGVLYTSFVVYLGWNWFIVPAGFKSITLAQSLGIYTLANIVRATYNQPAQRMYNDFLWAKMSLYGFSTMALVFMCVAKLFVYFGF